jgi:hypothetical protein
MIYKTVSSMQDLSNYAVAPANLLLGNGATRYDLWASKGMSLYIKCMEVRSWRAGCEYHSDCRMDVVGFLSPLSHQFCSLLGLRNPLNIRCSKVRHQVP